MKFRSISLTVVIGLVLVVALAACGGGASQPASSSGQTFNVTATEFKFEPNSFNAKAGDQLTFKITNKGTVDHNFVILNADGSQELAKTEIKVGQTATLNYTPPAAGTYQIDCNLPGHKEAGMTGTLTVK